VTTPNAGVFPVHLTPSSKLCPPGANRRSHPNPRHEESLRLFGAYHEQVPHGGSCLDQAPIGGVHPPSGSGMSARSSSIQVDTRYLMGKNTRDPDLIVCHNVEAMQISE